MNISDILSLLSDSMQLNQKVLHQHHSVTSLPSQESNSEWQTQHDEEERTAKYSGAEQLSKMTSNQYILAEPPIRHHGHSRTWEAIQDEVWVNLKSIGTIWWKQSPQLCSPMPLNVDTHNPQVIRQPSSDPISIQPPQEGEWIQLSIEETPLLIYSCKETSAISLYLELVELPNRNKCLQASTFNIPHSQPKSNYNEPWNGNTDSITNSNPANHSTALHYLALSIGQTLRFTDIAHPKNRDLLSPILKWRAELLPIQEEIIKRYQLRLQHFLMQELSTYGLSLPSNLSYPNPKEMLQIIDARDKVASLSLVVHLMTPLINPTEKSQPTKLQSQLRQIDCLLEPLISSWLMLPEDQPPTNFSSKETLERALFEDSSAYWTNIIPQLYP